METKLVCSTPRSLPSTSTPPPKKLRSPSSLRLAGAIGDDVDNLKKMRRNRADSRGGMCLPCTVLCNLVLILFAISVLCSMKGVRGAGCGLDVEPEFNIKWIHWNWMNTTWMATLKIGEIYRFAFFDCWNECVCLTYILLQLIIFLLWKFQWAC